MKLSEIRPEVYELARRAEIRAAEQFAALEEISRENTYRVMDAFQSNRVSESCFAGTTGYGYDDLLFFRGRLFRNRFLPDLLLWLLRSILLSASPYCCIRPCS